MGQRVAKIERSEIRGQKSDGVRLRAQGSRHNKSRVQSPNTKPGPSPEGGDSEGETGNPPARWESEGQILGFQVSGVRRLSSRLFSAFLLFSPCSMP